MMIEPLKCGNCGPDRKRCERVKTVWKNGVLKCDMSDEYFEPVDGSEECELHIAIREQRERAEKAEACVVELTTILVSLCASINENNSNAIRLNYTFAMRALGQDVIKVKP